MYQDGVPKSSTELNTCLYHSNIGWIIWVEPWIGLAWSSRPRRFMSQKFFKCHSRIPARCGRVQYELRRWDLHVVDAVSTTWNQGDAWSVGHQVDGSGLLDVGLVTSTGPAQDSARFGFVHVIPHLKISGSSYDQDHSFRWTRAHSGYAFSHPILFLSVYVPSFCWSLSLILKH